MKSEPGPPTAASTAHLHGLSRTLVANMVDGVTNGFEKYLEIQGVGYREQLEERTSSPRSATRTPSRRAATRRLASRCPQRPQNVVKGT